MSDQYTPALNSPPSDNSSNSTSSIDSPPLPTPRSFPTRPLAIALLVVCPILILVPPRKLDLYTFSLGTAWAVSAQKLYVIESQKSPTWMMRRRQIATAANEERADEKSQSFSGGEIDSGEREEQGGVAGMARRLWMGKEQPGWQERRLREDQEKLDEGESYAGLIGNAIMEAFTTAKEAEGDARDDAKEQKSEKDG